MRSVLPDIHRNLRTMGRALPVGSMLMTIDLRPEIRTLVRLGMPFLAEWGCFDRVATTGADGWLRVRYEPVPRLARRFLPR